MYCKPAACTGVEELHKLIGAHVEEGIEIHTSEGELLECSLLGLNGPYLDFWVRLQKAKTKFSLSKLKPKTK